MHPFLLSNIRLQTDIFIMMTSQVAIDRLCTMSNHILFKDFIDDNTIKP